MKSAIIYIAILTAMVALIPSQVDAQCNCYPNGIYFVMHLDFWGWDDYCDCCYGCQNYNYWDLPFEYWPICWRRIIRVYYSPCGWYRYVYHDYPCASCTRVYVENRWVYRRPIRLDHHYNYRDRANDFNRRRGLGNIVRYRDSSPETRTREYTERSTREHNSTPMYRTSRESNYDSDKKATYRTKSNNSSSTSRSTRSETKSSNKSSSSTRKTRTKRSKL